MKLCSNLSSPVIPGEYHKEKNHIIGYLRVDHRRVHNLYILRFVICETMNFVIVIINMSILNGIFDNFWMRYFPVVSSLFSTDGESFSNLSTELFPKLAKCIYYDFGPSGSQQTHDALCLLSLNILNDKIFAFLYVWFSLLVVVSICNLIIRIIILITPCIRLKMIRSLAKSSVPLTKNQLELVLLGDHIGDWFILYLLGRNLNPFVFREILDDLASNAKRSNEEVN
ncbi:Innexin inx4 [Pseudolycoriella hygida]|uniref:Innexin n=1 Tax=Pseudolycoriella hygida TaxID=35572 RepID=A0A9Q0MQ83_9DIPT|nr:Innexin inx4 [Pseudolycoriella hygida]